ncbi:hypothetical protein LEMLEM_LOCUS11103 [Lemmus lemmus]
MLARKTVTQREPSTCGMQSCWWPRPQQCLALDIVSKGHFVPPAATTGDRSILQGVNSRLASRDEVELGIQAMQILKGFRRSSPLQDTPSPALLFTSGTDSFFAVPRPSGGFSVVRLENA